MIYISKIDKEYFYPIKIVNGTISEYELLIEPRNIGCKKILSEFKELFKLLNNELVNQKYQKLNEDLNKEIIIAEKISKQILIDIVKRDINIDINEFIRRFIIDFNKEIITILNKNEKNAIMSNFLNDNLAIHINFIIKKYEIYFYKDLLYVYLNKIFKYIHKVFMDKYTKINEKNIIIKEEIYDYIDSINKEFTNTTIGTKKLIWKKSIDIDSEGENNLKTFIENIDIYKNIDDNLYNKINKLIIEKHNKNGIYNLFKALSINIDNSFFINSNMTDITLNIKSINMEDYTNPEILCDIKEKHELIMNNIKSYKELEKLYNEKYLEKLHNEIRTNKDILPSILDINKDSNFKIYYLKPITYYNYIYDILFINKSNYYTEYDINMIFKLFKKSASDDIKQNNDINKYFKLLMDYSIKDNIIDIEIDNTKSKFNTEKKYIYKKLLNKLIKNTF